MGLPALAAGASGATTLLCDCRSAVDTPSMFGLCFGVNRPGMACPRGMPIGTPGPSASGVGRDHGATVKIVGAFFGDWVRRSLPRSAMLAALFGRGDRA